MSRSALRQLMVDKLGRKDAERFSDTQLQDLLDKGYTNEGNLQTATRELAIWVVDGTHDVSIHKGWICDFAFLAAPRQVQKYDFRHVCSFGPNPGPSQRLVRLH